MKMSPIAFNICVTEIAKDNKNFEKIAKFVHIWSHWKRLSNMTPRLPILKDIC